MQVARKLLRSTVLGKLLYLVAVLWVVIIVAASGLTTVSAQDADDPAATPTPTAAPSESTPSPGGEMIREAELALREAQIATNQASSALDTVNLMLAYIQVIGTVFAIGGAIAAVIGVRNSNNVRQELGAELERLRAIEDQSRAALDTIRQERIQITTLSNAIERTLADVDRLRDEVDDSRTLLDERALEIAQSLKQLEQTQSRLDSKFEAEFDRLNTQISIKLENLDARNRNSNQATALTQLAQQQISIGNLEAAAVSLARAIEFDEENHVIQYFLGDVYVRLGRLDESVGYLEKALADNEDYPDAQASYAYAIRLKGDRESDELKRSRYYDESRDIFMRLYRYYPELLDLSGESVYGALASIYRRTNQIDEAIRWYEIVREITPLNSYPVNNLALLHYLQGNMELSRKYFTDSLEMANRSVVLSPSDYWRWFDYITAQVALGDEPFARIKDRLEDVFELDPGEDPLNKLLDGLKELERAPIPPTNIDRIIRRVQTELDRLAERQQNDSRRPENEPQDNT